MDKDKAFQNMISILEENDECIIVMDDGEEYSIAPANYYVGGSEGYYICDYLGNIQYPSIEEVCNEFLARIDCSKIKEITINY